MADNAYFLGLDIGTSGVKAVLFNETGKMMGSAHREYHFSNPKPGWSEIDPEEVWGKTKSAINECVIQSTVPADRIKALGLSVLGETCMPLDEKGNSLYPAIDSQDKKENGYQKYLNWFQDRYGAEKIYQITSYPLAFIAPALRLMWLQDHEPEIFRRMVKFVTFQDFTLLRLTGKTFIDYSMASRTLLFDAQKKSWVKEFLDDLNVSSEILSEPCLSSNVVGHLSEEIANELGLSPDVMIVAGAHDQSCSSLGIGGIQEGIASDGTGSVEAIGTPTHAPFISQSYHDLGFSSECHLNPDLYLALGYHLTAGSLVRWYRDYLGKFEIQKAQSENRDAYQLITESAQQSPPGANGLLVLPHWSGAGTGHYPMLNPSSRGAILGLTLAHKKSDLDRAIFEGICFEARLIIETFEKAEIPIDAFVVTGGGAKSPFWLQLKADIIGKPMKVPETTEASAMGAAMLAAVGSGFFINFEDAVKNFCRIKAEYFPEQSAKGRYDHIFNIYQDLYQSVIDINTRLSRVDFEKF